ncbi:MAG: membrane fusion protein (multidrug efflux system) [Candidatus Latescibacterota bacterium]|jgi:membrane fusion protein (multidrug efflux system)
MAASRWIGAAALCWLSLGTVHAQERDLDGLIEPYEVVAISSQVPGILDEVKVERGDIVSEGQVLARLKDRLEKIAVELARARVEFSSRRSARNEELYEDQLISVHERDELETEIQINKLQVEEAKEILAMRTIRSPVQGVVVERSRAPGESVGADPILTVARIDLLNVEVIAPVERFGSIVKGMRAEVRPEEAVGGVYIGEVMIVNQVIDAASGTFGVRVEIPNSEYKLPAGLKCKVRFLLD